ncbi:MAG TPA: RdgB/HAM1 family non-canonical purine NTP pyrophosphatase [Chitinophagaceae bacterium]|nr:RdgB/HAM1 family non-canonical purine NTP pyrophosphatase [Chitinophagaceae bacterium]
MKLIFATNNQHKITEIISVLPEGFEITTLREAGINIEIPEPYNTLKENAREKARVIYRLTKANCFSEDTGLEVFALNGEPGVKTARYAGEHASSQKNIEKLLHNLTNITNRSAQFRTIICLINKSREFFFEGTCTGTIGLKKIGVGGFGYDPVFIPDGVKVTLAQMSLEEKNRFSHRKKAVDKLVEFLKR